MPTPDRRDGADGRGANGIPVRCAIYTRKSSEEGLEQDFNSLHAQREACEAYIRSQKHAGWIVLPDAYDDGGISGATMERPALQRLLAQIAARKVDTVVVYKVDRLTRTLSDFARIVDIFDHHSVAFVSVTQQFNTTTSMGRLTLNVLLSFAQFEREVTGERIRDKIAASKRKGLWMGGTPPLGYDVRDRKLMANQAEAATVRHIFARYAALRSVRLLQRELELTGVTSKCWTSRSGRHWGGGPLARGALYLLLQNRIYRGEIVHKDQHFPGEHSAIVEPELWDRVQAVLAENGAEHQQGGRATHPSLLAGLIHDGDGHRMTATHAVKNGRRYRYYISRPLIEAGRPRTPGACRVPAAEVEQVVTERLRTFLADGPAVFDAVCPTVTAVAEPKRLVERAAALAAAWPTLSPSRLRGIVTTLLSRVEVTDSAVTLHLSSRVAAALDPTQPAANAGASSKPADAAAGGPCQPTIVLVVPARLARIGQGTRLIMATPGAPARVDAAMIQLLVKAHQVQRRLLAGEHGSIAAFAPEERVTASYIARLVRLAWLAPDITQAILTGRQPPALTANRLMQSGPLPMDWQDQRHLLGFG